MYTASAPKSTAVFKTSSELAGISNSGFRILLSISSCVIVLYCAVSLFDRQYSARQYIF